MTSGCRPRNSSSAGGVTTNAASGEAPIETTARPCIFMEASVSTRATSERISRARGSRCSPLGVRVMPREFLSSNSVPRDSSSRLMDLVSETWL